MKHLTPGMATILLIVVSFSHTTAQTSVVLPGTFQSEVSNNVCGDWLADCYSTELIFKPGTSIWENSFVIPAGCWEYKVALNGSWSENYGVDGIRDGANILLYIPQATSITFQYDSVTHLVSSSPYSGVLQVVTKISLFGSLQSETGCSFDYDNSCDNSALNYNSVSGKWEGKFILPEGCYNYQIKETVGCGSSINYYGNNAVLSGDYIPLYIPSETEITFSYDAGTHLITSTPYNGAPPSVSLYGDLQSELGCAKDFDTCDNASLSLNTVSGKWEGTFTLPPGCYSYIVVESAGCTNAYYGDNGNQNGSFIQLYVPSEGEINFSYDQQTHLMSSTPYSGAPQTLNKVTLIGDFQNELGCVNDYDYLCDNASLALNAATGDWEGKFILPTGCYQYQVKETVGCSSVSVYGENGVLSGNSLKLYVPETGEISFTHNSQTHIISATPNTDPSQIITQVSLYGDLQTELGCQFDFNIVCSNATLSLNSITGKWEGKFILPAGCYQFVAAQLSGCDVNATLYGTDGIANGGYYQLYLPSETEITFVYDPQTHITVYTPIMEAPVTVSLYGSLQNELGCPFDYDYSCTNSLLTYNPTSNMWEGKFNLPAGCYQYQVAEALGCNSVVLYGENGVPGSSIQFYIATDEEVSFSYDIQTHTITSSPSGSVSQTITKVSLVGNLEDELGCPFDYDVDCDNPAFTLNTASGKWEGKFLLPAGCYQFQVKETIGCFTINYYGQNGEPFGTYFTIYVGEASEVTFSYDPATHIVTSDAPTTAPATSVSLVGNFQAMLGCAYDWNYWDCNTPAFLLNTVTGLWEASFHLEPGCYTYVVKTTDGCNNTRFYDNDGNPGAEFSTSNRYGLYLDAATDVILKFNPETNLISSNSDTVCLPATVVIPGTFQSELGCQPNFYTGDWEPACDATRLVLDTVSKLFVGTFNIPAGSWEYKIAYNNSWEENYGLNGEYGGPNIPLELCAASAITFKYNYSTHLVDLEFNPSSICITKFYDANVNGIDDDSIRVAGIRFKLSGKKNAVSYTDASGRANFYDLNTGRYKVTERMPHKWVSTTGITQSVLLNAPVSLSFGNVCLGAGGGHPANFWLTGEGENIIKDENTAAPEMALLSSLNLQDADGNDFNPASCNALKTWLRNANGRNIAYRLSVQLASLQLSVEAGFVNENALVYTAGCGDSATNYAFTSVRELINKINNALNIPGDESRNTGRYNYLRCLAYAIKKANSDRNFVQAAPCPLNEGNDLSKTQPAEEDDNYLLDGVKIWPNPTHSYFTLRLPVSWLNKKVSIKIYEATGRLLYSAGGNGNKDYRFGDSFIGGLYLIEVVHDGIRQTYKVLKQ